MASKAKPQEETSSFTATAHLSENGAYYKPGETLELTPERAAALGDLVTPATAD